MRLRIAAFADSHLDERHKWPETIAAWDAMLADFKAQGVTHIIGAGDLVGRDAPHEPTVKENQAFAWYVRRMQEIAPTYLITGNHERPGDRGYWNDLRGHGSFLMATTPGTRVEPEASFIFVPYQSVGTWCGATKPDTERATLALQGWVEQQLTLLPNDTSRILVMHYPVLGARAGGWEQQRGNDIVLDPEWLRSLRVDYIALGHIHQRQSFDRSYKPDDPRNRIWYSGSLTPQARNETGAHGYNLVTIEQVEGVTAVSVEFRPIPSWEYVNITAEVINGHPYLKVGQDIETEGPFDCLVKVKLAVGETIPTEAIVRQLPPEFTDVTIKALPPVVTERVAPEIARLPDDNDRLTLLMQRKGLDAAEQAAIRQRFVEVRS